MKTSVVTGDDLVAVYLDGFASGMSSVLATFVGHEPDARRDAYVERFMTNMLEDPAVRETVMNEIRERLTDTDTGPKTLAVDL